MFLIYDLLFIIFSLFYLPKYILRKRKPGNLWMRLGFLPSDIVNKLRGNRVIWLHAVSVGEVLASLSIIQALKKEFPEHKLVISTVTRTGFDLAGQILKDDVVIYFPLDLTLPVQRVLNHIHPEIILPQKKSYFKI